jgi:dihydroxyacid dehydratase/phosphogluconate dehydratase
MHCKSIHLHAFAINHPPLAVLDLAKIVKGAVQKQGMLGWQYNTIGISDGITMGGEGWFPSPASCQNTNPKLISETVRHAILSSDPRTHR